MHCPKTVFCIMALLLGGTLFSWAEEAQEDSSSSAQQEEQYEKHWYFSMGALNYHPRMKESEAMIDREINQRLGIIPGWQRPETFKDWEEDWLIWGSEFGIGRDITPKSTITLWTGGSYGYINNPNQYGFIGTDVNFVRWMTFISMQYSYYFYGKPEYFNPRGMGLGERLGNSISNARPYASAALSYVVQYGEAEVNVEVPYFGTVAKEKVSFYHHIYEFSPRMGMEFPVNTKDSFWVEAIYYFIGPDHNEEYGGPAWAMGMRHRF